MSFHFRYLFVTIFFLKDIIEVKVCKFITKFFYRFLSLISTQYFSYIFNIRKILFIYNFQTIKVFLPHYILYIQYTRFYRWKKVVQNTYANLENKVRSYKPINNHHLDRWLNEGIILCNFCFTNTLFQSISTISNNSKSYYLLFEPFINNLVEYIFNDHPVVFMLFGSINSSIRKSIENKCSVVIISYPIKKYFKFKDSDIMLRLNNLLVTLDTLLSSYVVIYKWKLNLYYN